MYPSKLEFLKKDEVKSKPFRIVHVTESLGGGVLYLLHQLIKAQIASGFEVTLVHSIRADTPSPETLNNLFPYPISRIILPMVTNISLRSDLKSFRDIAKFFAIKQPDVIHLHSSKAGALGRAAARFVGLGNRAYYSPHGFSFLRQDISEIKRAIFFLMEKLGGLICGKLIVSSMSEMRLAKKLIKQTNIFLVENCTDISCVQNTINTSSYPLRIMSAGRLCYQKAPWLFWDLTTSLERHDVSFVWVGDGEMRENLKKKYSFSNVLVTGWVDRDELWREMLMSDIFIMTSLWEGMPLTLIDAQALGLPAIVPDVVGCRDVVIDGVTGYVCKNDKDFLDKTTKLINDAELRLRMGQAAKNMCLERFTVKRMSDAMIKVYESNNCFHGAE